MREKAMSSSIYIRHQGGNVRILLSQIVYIEADRNYTILVLEDGQYMAPYRLVQWETVLPREQFCRVHRGYIVSLSKIISFDKRIIRLPARELPVGEEYVRQLESAVTVLDPSYFIRNQSK